MRGEVDLVDHEQVAVANPRPPFTGDLVPLGHVDDEDEAVGQFARENGGEVVAAGLDDYEFEPRDLGERLAAEEGTYVDRRVIKPASAPIEPQGGLVALFGSLAPAGCIIKRSAATPALFEKTGRAVVFTSIADLSARIDSPDLDVTADDFLVLQNAGPASPAAMPEAGFLPIPKKLLVQGVKDMVRISDCRMSGTAYGTIVLHVAPEAAAGGPLGLVQTGDRIRLSVKERKIDLLVAPAELERRRKGKPAAASDATQRGYDKLFRRSVLQAPDGCDFDFLRPVPAPR